MPGIRGSYVPSQFDGRDIEWPYEEHQLSSVQLLRPPIKNQGTELDSCTSMALSTAFEIVDSRNGQTSILSPLFNYYFSRGNPNYFGPVALRTSLHIAERYGICRKEFYDIPPTPEAAVQRPSQEAILDAKAHRLLAYDANTGTAGFYTVDGINKLNKWRDALSVGQPIIAGIWTQSSYWNGLGMLESEVEENLGAHAVCVVGFDESTSTFNVLDSRGRNFASNGEWLLGYNTVMSGRIIESWTIRTLTYNT